MDIKEALKALTAIGHESRLAIFRIQVQIGPKGVAARKIPEQLAISPASVSFHLKELVHANHRYRETSG